MSVADAELKLHLSKHNVVAGHDSYSISVIGWNSVPIRVAFRIDDGPLETFGVRLDHSGAATFDVASYTRKGLYTFVAFKLADGNQWFRASESLLVQ